MQYVLHCCGTHTARDVVSQTEPLKQWTHTLHDACTVPWVLTKMYQSPCLRRPASQMIGRLIAIAYDVTHGFVQAHSFVSEQVSRWGFGREASIVIEESRAQVRLAAQQMEVLDRTYPKHSRGVRVSVPAATRAVGSRVDNNDLAALLARADALRDPIHRHDRAAVPA